MPYFPETLFCPCLSNKLFASPTVVPSETFMCNHRSRCLQGNRRCFPGPGGQPGYSVHDEGFSLCQSLWDGGGPLGTPAVCYAGSHRDDPHCAASLDLPGGTVSSNDAHVWGSPVWIPSSLGDRVNVCSRYLLLNDHQRLFTATTFLSLRTFFGVKISGSSCLTSAKSLKTLAAVGRASWADSTATTELYREHITLVWKHVCIHY